MPITGEPMHVTMCDMCLKVKETTHFNLYTSGSEGTNLCHKCEMAVVDFIVEQTHIALRKRKEEHIQRQKGD